MAKVISRNPGSGEILAELDPFPTGEIPALYARARAAQERWAEVPLSKRASALLDLREVLLNRADETVALISRENGKPAFEALSNELLPAVDMLTFFSKSAPSALRDRRIPLALMKHRKSILNHWPIGTVLVIAPWNYPFLLPFADILMAIVSGNAVVFKPSEITPLVGLKIQDLCWEAGFPRDLVQVVVGDGTLGAALVQNRPDKVFFTGSVETGKKVMTAAAAHLIPVNLELGGKDPMIVLPDADLDFATSAAIWGAFSNSGQVCASTERLILHEKIAPAFLALLKQKLATLRRGSDLGPITLERQKTTYDNQLTEARAHGAELVAGGHFSDDGRFLEPTVLTGPEIESMAVYKEETFGPVLAVTTFRSVDEAITKANDTPYGLLASIITRDLDLGEKIAKRLHAGSVLINEVTYTAGLGETPWGGVKASGLGRTHSEAGLLEFVHVRHIHAPRGRLSVFKSPWWFPYTPFQEALFRSFLRLYRKNWLDKLRAVPELIWNFAQFLKNEKRL